MTRASPRWIFDALPPSGARRGGDPSEHAFRHDLATLVREVVQNANDHAAGWPAVRFCFIELDGDRLASFRAALDWSSLLPHLEGAARSKGGEALGEFLEQLGQTNRLLLLQVQDRNTEGLTGAEADGDSHFRALCKDTLYSHKASDSAGGSYGLGKSVLWTFSGLSTVLFNSVLMAHQNGQASPRLIGRAELPSHRARSNRRQRWYTGSGWFGVPARAESGAERAESLWAEQAAARADALCLAREDRHGTSILIIGFRDPTSEQNDATGQLVRRVQAAATQYFWPAMIMDGRRLRISVGDEQAERFVDVDRDSSVMPFVDCYRRRSAPDSELERPGDVVVRPLSVELPRRRDKVPVARGHVDLIVRLAAEGRRDPLLNHVALFRGPGMVVRYWDRSSLTIGMRPFHAVVVCGEARQPRDPSAADVDIEHFLRAAEPPGHDDWLATAKLKQSYQRGYAKTIQTLKDRISAELRRLLVLRPSQGSRGPERLQRRFPIGSRAGRGSGPSAFRFRGLQARYVHHQWHCEGCIEPVKRGQPWRVRVSLNELGDDGQAVDNIPIAELTLESEDAEVELQHGEALLYAPPTTERLTFRARSVPFANPMPGELGVELTGEIGAEGS